MKKNMAVLDRGIRIVAAVVIAGLYLSDQISGTPGTVVGVVALLFLLTSLVGFCPFYVPLRIATTKK
ncbi:MAG: DUF2892 domain-containing protein [Bacteroidota bacterium]